MAASRARLWWALWLLPLAAASSCILGDFSLETASGGTGGNGGSGSGGDPICEHARWPDPPDTAAGDGHDFTVAMRSLSFGEDDLTMGPTIGYDLDQRCNCQGETSACISPDTATADHCDGPDGRDNAAAQLIATITNFRSSFSSEGLSQDIEQGEWSVLVRVRDYNGEANDSQVRVSLHPSPGVGSDACAQSGQMPAWDGEDRWPVSSFSLEGVGGGGQGGGDPCQPNQPDPALDHPAFEDPNAYVNDNVLVASLPTAGLTLSSGTIESRITLVAGFITAELVPFDDGRWSLQNGILTGRWPEQDLLGAMSSIVADGEPLCTDDMLYQLLKTAACSYVDIESAIGSPTAPCDALSFAVSFQAQPIRLGSVFIPSGTPMGCDPMFEPSMDSCDAPPP